MKKSLEGIFDDTVPDGKVKTPALQVPPSPTFAASKFRINTKICYFAISKHRSCSTYNSFVGIGLPRNTVHFSFKSKSAFIPAVVCCIPTIPSSHGVKSQEKHTAAV